jgi:hypothetical protein
MKMPPSTNLPIQMIARRRFNGLDCIIGAPNYLLSWSRKLRRIS